MNAFEAIFGTAGYCNGNSDIIVTKGQEKMKRLLTVVNKSVDYQIFFLKKQLANNPKSPKAPEMMQQLDELMPQRVVEYFDENEDGLLSIPAGFWYLIENLDGKEKGPAKLQEPMPAPRARRPYQEDSVAALLQHRRAMISLATGLGKQLISIEIARSFLAENKRTMVIVPTIALVQQGIKTFKEAFPGRVITGLSSKTKYTEGADVCITTIQSCSGYLSSYHCVIVDETHHASAKNYDCLYGYDGCVYGMTATPVRSDNLELGFHSHCGPVVYERDARWGIANGWLTPVKVLQVHIDGPRIPDTCLSAYAYKGACKAARSAIAQILESRKHKRCLVLFKTVKEGEGILPYLQAEGLNVALASSAKRQGLHDFIDSKVSILIANSGLLAEGLDIKDVSVVVNCTMSSGEVMTKQILGRGVRLSDGKKLCEIFDMCVSGYSQYESAANKRENYYKEITDKVLKVSIN